MGFREEATLVINGEDATHGLLTSVRNEVIKLTGAYFGFQKGLEIVTELTTKTVDYNASLVSLNAVASATGRDQNKLYAEMNKQLGGVADKAQVASGYLKGMTTELSLDQITDLTQRVKEASIAMGEDFGVQLPLITKAIKQLNPAILDNIGVTVRLDEVNKHIRDGYYGAGTAINEFTQQNAIYQEIMKQTAKYQGQEQAMLDTTKGKFVTLKAAVVDLGISFASVFTDSVFVGAGLDTLSYAARGLADFIGGMETRSMPTVKELSVQFDNTADSLESLIEQFRSGSIELQAFQQQMEAAINPDSNLAANAEAQINDLVQRIVNSTKDVSKAQQMLFDVFATRDLPMDAYFEARDKLEKTFQEMIDAQEITIEDIDARWAAFYQGLIIESDAGTNNIAEIWETLHGLLAQGFIFPGEKEGLYKLLESFGFTEEDITTAFKDRWSAAVDTANSLIGEALDEQAKKEKEYQGKLLTQLDNYSQEVRMVSNREMRDQAENRAKALDIEVEYYDGKKQQLWDYHDFMTEIQQQITDLEIIGLEESQARHAIALQMEYGYQVEHNQQMAELARQRAALELNISVEQFNQQLSLEMQKYQATMNYLNNIGRQIESGLRSSVQRWVSETDSGAVVVRDIFKDLGKSIRSVVVDVILDALISMVSAILSKIIPALIGEGVAVRALTTQYIALAAAKSAVNPTSAPGRIAAAAAVKGTLIPMLLGFDDPQNDAIARKWGVDAGDQFMAGFTSVTGAPQFGQRVVGSLQRGRNSPAITGGAGAISIVFQGPVVGTDFVNDQLAPELEQAVRRRASSLVTSSGMHTTTFVQDPGRAY